MSKCIKLVDNVYLVDTEEDMRKACNDCQNFNYSDIEFDALVTVEVKQYPAIIVTQKGRNDHSIKVQPLPIAPSIVSIIAERMHQLSKGYTVESDAGYANLDHDRLLNGAIAYAKNSAELWPFNLQTFHPENERTNYVKAVSMLIAHIDMLDANK